MPERPLSNAGSSGASADNLDVSMSRGDDRNVVNEFNAFERDKAARAFMMQTMKVNVSGNHSRDYQTVASNPSIESQRVDKGRINSWVRTQAVNSPSNSGFTPSGISSKHFEIVMKLQGLTEVPLDRILSNKSLRHIDLSYNKLSKVPAELFLSLPNLQRLVLDSNQLTSMPKLDGPSLAKNHVDDHHVLSKLQYFSASNNKLSELPMFLFLRKIN